MLSLHSHQTNRVSINDLITVLGKIPLIIILALDQVVVGAVLPDEAVDYNSHVKPIFTERCYACHASLKQEGGLRLDTVASMITGGESGRVVLPGRAKDSELVQRLRDADDSIRMPPEGQPLSESQIQQIEAWIYSGAPAPVDDAPQADPLKHWAFQLPLRAKLTSADSHAGLSDKAEVPEGLRQQEEPIGLENPVATGFSPTSGVSATADHPIDQLLAIQQKRLGIEPLPQESYRTLVRRLYIDLLGIPPTPQQISQALCDSSPNAYENLVDRLLSQSEYGERWGRHWMDVWRYSDWYGRRSVPDVMNSYPQIWRWRDWIVRSLNEDKGYDQMIMQMLAADEIQPFDDPNIVATGFLVRNWYKWNYESWMKDNVEHVGKALLGLTMNCAHCHDHKYDPITQEDYFRFRAFFEPLELRHDRVTGEADPGPFKKYVYADSYGPISTGAIRVFDEKLDAKTYLYLGGDSRNRVDGKEAIDAEPPRALTATGFTIAPVSLSDEAYYPGLKDFIRKEEQSKVESELAKAQAAFEQSSLALAAANTKLDNLLALSSQPLSASGRPSEDALEQAEHLLTLARVDWRIAMADYSVAQARRNALASRIAADDAKYRGLGEAETMAKRAHHAEKQLAMETAQLAEAQAQRELLLAIQQAQQASPDKADEAMKAEVNAREVLQAARTAIDAAQAGLFSGDSTYTPLSPTYPSTSTGRRLALARWIASDQNPLTARVAVNHLWLRHFGQALVETTDNFGLQGSPPQHPVVLDWLAIDLMENGWSMKHVHRMIVTSQAYRRSSNPPLNHPGLERDPDNASYWRFVPRRMEAESVRDSVLACSGALDRTLGGPDIDHAQWASSPRRSMYFTIHGEAKMQFLDTFDGPNVSECYRRSSSVMPQQALALTNSELLVHHGRLLASKITADLNGKHGQVNNEHRNSEVREAEFVRIAFETVLGRPPRPQELEVSLQFLAEQTAIFQVATHDELCVTPHKDVTPASGDKAQRARENLAISLFSHHDFVTIR